MTKSEDHTRREFLLKLAKATAFVPPVIATLDVHPVAGGGAMGAMAAATTTSAGMGMAAAVTVVGGASSTAQLDSGLRFEFRGSAGSQTPTAQPGGRPTAPWAKPPPGGD